jgi:predicted dienelactone hydrolase
VRRDDVPQGLTLDHDRFARGPFPVGVRTLVLVDGARDRRELPVEVWYPAAARYAGQDLAEATRDRYEILPFTPKLRQDAVRDAAPTGERAPLVVFSHAYGAHRRGSSFLTTHLASHGYVVAAVDHVGNTTLELLDVVLTLQAGRPLPDQTPIVRASIAARPVDVRFVIDCLLDGAGDVAVRPDAVGVAGHSLGGWTALTTTAKERRIRATLALAPAGGANPPYVSPLIEQNLDLGWEREVPVLCLVAARDSLLPLDAMRALFARLPSSRKTLVVFEDADHSHFCDRVEEVHDQGRTLPHPPDMDDVIARMVPSAELCPGERANAAVRGLGLAHFDAHLKGDAASARWLGTDAAAALAARGVRVHVA